MQCDNYADLRIEYFAEEYQQVRAGLGRADILYGNIERTEYPAREC